MLDLFDVTLHLQSALTAPPPRAYINRNMLFPIQKRRKIMDRGHVVPIIDEIEFIITSKNMSKSLILRFHSVRYTILSVGLDLAPHIFGSSKPSSFIHDSISSVWFLVILLWFFCVWFVWTHFYSRLWNFLLLICILGAFSRLSVLRYDKCYQHDCAPNRALGWGIWYFSSVSLGNEWVYYYDSCFASSA